ncbi:hypothetical protein AMELA_G00157000 [Ameiurus melas]|uniref:Uncharacterized protein n=1 Tax=Ameiurus melas TaxID=219545 RepID=A0A7J6AGS8_AMEME|nr:hypothetical protein AMELA_G00157000 [Ameiurus melas]
MNRRHKIQFNPPHKLTPVGCVPFTLDKTHQSMVIVRARNEQSRNNWGQLQEDRSNSLLRRGKGRGGKN